MTLIISKIIGERIYILGDTKLTHPTTRLSGPYDENIKIIPINSNLCIAFAGIQELAIDAIRSLEKLRDSPLSVILEFLLNKHLGSNKAFDFVITSLSPRLEMYKISSGQCYMEIGSCWIGDINGFSLFQNHFKNHTPALIPSYDEKFLLECPHLRPERQVQLQKMIFAFREVVSDNSIPSVGGFTTRMLGVPGIGYKYEPQTEGFDPIPIRSTTEEQSLIRPSPAESGGYNFTLLASELPNIPAVGVWILQNQLGLFYSPIHHVNPIIFSDCTCLEFVSSVNQEFGIRLTGFFIN